MIKGQKAGEGAIAIDVTRKVLLLVRCGKSSNQTFCDGSHKDTDFKPFPYKADQSKKVFFCTCKQTNDQPICDGSHNI